MKVYREFTLPKVSQTNVYLSFKGTDTYEQIFMVLSVSIEILRWSVMGQLAHGNQSLTLASLKRISSAPAMQLYKNSHPAFMRFP